MTVVTSVSQHHAKIDNYLIGKRINLQIRFSNEDVDVIDALVRYAASMRQILVGWGARKIRVPRNAMITVLHKPNAIPWHSDVPCSSPTVGPPR
jgi:alpha-D-ribose 1-methylphosphonate 5-triphosphate synthase subunit PhnL